MPPSFIKDRHYRKARKLCDKHVQEVRAPELVENPLLSVLFITYNHASFVRQALDSVLMQKTSFPFEIVISDDCSTDGTREIVQEYYEKHPDKIRLLLSDKNLWNFRGNGHGSAIFLKLFEAGYRSKYNALLEGDDYWTRDDKLQIQVDFLESNPEYSACHHNIYVLKKNTEIFTLRKEKIVKGYNKNTFKYDFIHVSSMLFNTSIYFEFTKYLMRYLTAGDLILNLYFEMNNGSYNMKSLEGASLHRRHDQGAWNGISLKKQKILILHSHIAKAEILNKMNWQVGYEIEYYRIIFNLQKILSQNLKNKHILAYYRYLLILFFIVIKNNDKKGVIYCLRKIFFVN